MKRLCFLLFMTFLLTGCCNHKAVKQYDTYSFLCENESYLITLTDDCISVSDKSGTLSYPVLYIFTDGVLKYESVVFPYTPLSSSVLQIGALFKTAVRSGTTEGEYLLTPYSITFEKDGTPKKLIWGDLQFDFIH